MSSLYEQYRPRTFTEVVGQPKAIAAVERLRERGLSGRALWLAGPSGTGKTTLARLIANEVASEDDTLEMDAGELTEAKVRELANGLQYRGLAGRGRCLIVNESHGLKRGVIRALLVILESIPKHAVWVFTTTCAGESTLLEDMDDASPLLSRVTDLPMAKQALAQPFAEHARRIAIAENLGDRPLADFIKLAKECRNNLRAMLSRIEAGCMLRDA